MKTVGWMTSHTVQVETYQGDGFRGANRAPAVEKRCGLDESAKLVLASNGSEVTSTATLFAPLADEHVYTPESWVTLRPGRRATVVTVARFESGSPSMAALDHIEVSLA